MNCPHCGAKAELGLFKVYCSTAGCVNQSEQKPEPAPHQAPARVWLSKPGVAGIQTKHGIVYLHHSPAFGVGHGFVSNSPHHFDTYADPVGKLNEAAGGEYNGSDLQREVVRVLGAC